VLARTASLLKVLTSASIHREAHLIRSSWLALRRELEATVHAFDAPRFASCTPLCGLVPGHHTVRPGPAVAPAGREPLVWFQLAMARTPWSAIVDMQGGGPANVLARNVIRHQDDQVNQASNYNIPKACNREQLSVAMAETNSF